MSVSRLELIRSDLFLKVFKSMNICDGCRDPVSVIIDVEQEDVVSAAFSKLSRKSGVSIIQGYTCYCKMLSIQLYLHLDPGKVASLLKRLGFVHESSSFPTFVKEPSLKNTDIAKTTNNAYDANDYKQFNHGNEAPKQKPEKECPHCHELFHSPKLKRHIAKCSLTPQAKEANKDLDLNIEDTEMGEVSKDNCGKCELDNGYGAMICCCNEKCAQWYHTSCVDLEDIDTETTDQDSEDIFYCPRCVERLNKDLFPCPFCDTEIVNRRSLIYTHYATSHFKEKLQSPDNNNICQLCGQKSRDQWAFIAHVGVKHNLLEKVLPKIYHLESPAISRKIREYSQTRLKEHMTNIEKLRYPDMESSLVSQKADDGEYDSKYQCKLCTDKIKFDNVSPLYRHYSQKHFKKELMVFIRKDAGAKGLPEFHCLVCNQRKAGPLWNVLAHVGAAHEKVNNFLSEEFQIEKQRNLNSETSFDEESKMSDRNQNRNDDLRSILDSDSDEDD